MKTAVVILAGGVGARLWPISRKRSPKQFAKILNDKSLLRNSFERITHLFNTRDIYVSGNIEHKDRILKEIPEMNEDNLILEPFPVGRSAAYCLICLKLLSYDSVLTIANDEHIHDTETFSLLVQSALKMSSNHPKNFIIIGMDPEFPSTGLGYIELGKAVQFEGTFRACEIRSFIEKPNKHTAEEFVSKRQFLWNTGMYIFNPNGLLEVYNEVQQELCLTLKQLSCHFEGLSISKKDSAKVSNEAFEHAILPKLKDKLVIPTKLGWMDIGSWKAVYKLLKKDEDENAHDENVVSVDSRKTLVISKNKKKVITLIGLENVLVVDTEDGLLISNIDKSQEVKKALRDMPDEFK